MLPQLAGLRMTEATNSILHAAPPASARLVLRGITKRYPAVVANSEVSLTV